MNRSTDGVTSLSSVFSNPPHGVRICIINIMDNAEGKKRHFERTIVASAPNAEITWCRMQCAKTDPKYFREQNHLLSDQYTDWQDVVGIEDFDLIIFTGINRGDLSYEDLKRDYPDFWAESCELVRVIQHSVTSGKTGHAALVCWSAFAYMKEMYGVEKGIHDQKFYGLFPHTVNKNHPLCQGFASEDIIVPQSRYSYMDADELGQVITSHHGDVAMNGPDGPAIWTLENRRITCFINHLEYSSETLQKEYEFGKSKNGGVFNPPQNYSFDPKNPDPNQIFERLSKSCATFYKNLISIAQLQKASSNNLNQALAPQIEYRKWAFGS